MEEDGNDIEQEGNNNDHLATRVPTKQLFYRYTCYQRFHLNFFKID